MATAIKKVHTATSPARAEQVVPGAPPLAFLTYSDNGGGYHWEIVDASGGILAHSENFTSQSDAERAARNVQQGARKARFEPHVAEERHTVAA